MGGVLFAGDPKHKKQLAHVLDPKGPNNRVLGPKYH